MKVLHIYIFLFIVNLCYCQQKTFTPKSGEIVFVKQESADDKARYIELGELLKGQLTDEKKQKGKIADTTAINQRLKEISATVNTAVNQIEKRHHEFKGDKIISYRTTDGIRGDYYSIINTKTGLNGMVAKRDSDVVHLPELPYYTPYAKGSTIKIIEYPKEVKKINGFDCFKLTAVTTSYIDEDDFSSLEITTNYEMWVTDKIKCLYHPVVWLKEVLEKYYPLEIIESSDMLAGKTVYSLSSFSLK